MNVNARRLLAIALIVSLAACAGTLTQPPEVRLSNIGVRELGLFEQRLALSLRVHNPNDARLAIRGLHYALELNGRPFATGSSEQSVDVPGFGEALIEVPAVVDTGGLLGQLDHWRGDSHRESLQYRLRGTLYTAYGAGIPFQYSGELPLSFLPKR